MFTEKQWWHTEEDMCRFLQALAFHMLLTLGLEALSGLPKANVYRLLCNIGLDATIFHI